MQKFRRESHLCCLLANPAWLSACTVLGLLLLATCSAAWAQRECQRQEDCPANAPYCINNNPNRVWQHICSECASQADCSAKDQVCDLVNARCVTSIPQCNTSTACGAQCRACPMSDQGTDGPSRPYCTNGQVCARCQVDADCNLDMGSKIPHEPRDHYCHGGYCYKCTHDRHCGFGCSSCKDDKPYCYFEQSGISSAVCVRCFMDTHCGPDGKCDQLTHTCMNETCAGGCQSPLHCYAGQCVRYYARSQCRFGVPDYQTMTCHDGTCIDNGDCPGNEACRLGVCEPGSYKEGVSLAGGAKPITCQAHAGGPSMDSRNGLPLAALCMLAVLLWVRRQRVRLR